jgi:hypothetical protein
MAVTHALDRGTLNKPRKNPLIDTQSGARTSLLEITLYRRRHIV